MKAASFVLKLGTVGPERVVLNGNDVTDHVEGVSLLCQEGSAPQVRLGLKPGVDVAELAGDGVVFVEPGEVGGSVVEWLSHIDPAELERQILDNFQPGATTGEMALMVLKNLAGAQ